MKIFLLKSNLSNNFIIFEKYFNIYNNLNKLVTKTTNKRYIVQINLYRQKLRINHLIIKN